MLHGYEAEELVPALHHLGGVGSRLGGEVGHLLALGEALDVLEHLLLVGCVEVLQLLLCLAQVAYHHAVARIDHVGHHIVHPEGAMLAELIAQVVFPAEGLWHLCDAAVDGHIGHHVGIVAVEVHHATYIIGQPATQVAHQREARLWGANGALAEVLLAIYLPVHRHGAIG